MDALKYIDFNKATQDSEVWEKDKYKGIAPIHQSKTPTGVKIVLGDYLKKIGLSQRSLSELCGLSQPALNDICENRTILLNIAHIVRVATVLGVSLDEIIQLVPIQESRYTESDSIYNVEREIAKREEIERMKEGSAN
jgi:transcriptional regulator with XRE-family HTH domain